MYGVPRMEQGCHDGDAVPLEDHVADLGLVVWVADNGVELGDAMSELAMVDIQAHPGLLPLCSHCMDTNKSSNMLSDWVADWQWRIGL